MGNSFRVLIVDDLPLMRLMISKYVASMAGEVLGAGPIDLQVTEARNGLDASERLEAQDFDLLILDLMMPVKDGLTLLQEIRRNSRHDSLKVLICSALENGEILERARAAGATGFVVKPFTLRSMTEAIRSACNNSVKAAGAGDEAPRESP